MQEVGKLIDLPNETPKVITVFEAEKLRSQPFFAKAQDYDQVLLFEKSKKAILYSPSQKKIIEVGPINVGSDSAQQNTQARIALRNGSGSSGLTNKIETQIKAAFPDANITSKANASKNNYEKTVVVYLNESAKGAADNLAKTLNVQSSATLPEGEVSPAETDLVIILGKDLI